MVSGISEFVRDRSNIALTLTIDNSEPIELEAFVKAFTSIANDYKQSLEKKGLDGAAEIYVAQVRAGSIIADLVPVVVSALPVVSIYADQLGQAIDFVEKWKSRIDALRNAIVPDGMGRNELKTVADAVQAIARDKDANSRLEVVTFEDNKRQVRAAFKFDTRDAIKITDTIEAETRRLEKEDNTDFERVLLYFTRSDKGSVPIDKRSGERAIAPEISERDLPVMYGSELAEQKIKDVLRQDDVNIFKKGFNVDLSVVSKGDRRPAAFRVNAVYQVFDLPEDDAEAPNL